MARVFITGDTHANMNLLYRRLGEAKLTADDYLIVAGDFGFIWNGDWSKNMAKLEKITPATILFIDGNHENFDLLEQMPEIYDERVDGIVGRCSNRVLHLLRGKIYTICGHTYFTFGGAQSIDKAERIPQKSWWYQEEPSVTELNEGEKVLMENIDKVEYVITHDCPPLLYGLLNPTYMAQYNLNIYSIWFNKWYRRLYYTDTFKCWFFGHHHQDKDMNGYNARCLYFDMVEIK